jgi:hypothetical protein
MEGKGEIDVRSRPLSRRPVRADLALPPELAASLAARSLVTAAAVRVLLHSASGALHAAIGCAEPA